MVCFKQYADDTQLFIALSSSNHTTNLDRLQSYLSKLNAWFCHTGLVLNADKPDVIIFGTRQQLRKCTDLTQVSVTGAQVAVSDSTRILDVTIDKISTFDGHVKSIYYIILSYTNENHAISYQC